ncbi:Integrase, catalytic core [Gossypium australe]|uniref:Integrase, catalytic core n=1 Tax=Gossypium australe TaxID=47621 RepID=A0A5B6X0K6_9ROSI|nr:Integrase, catalytic core [Gossypium australe]
MRHIEGAFQARNKKIPCSSSNKGKKKWNERKDRPKRDGEKKKYSPCNHCKKTITLKAYSSSTDDFDLWHKRLGHVNFRSYRLLCKHGLVENMSEVVERIALYEVCQFGKQTRLPFHVNKAWSDNGIEYTSEMFQEFCEDVRIEHQLTNTYTPQKLVLPTRDVKDKTLNKLERRAQLGIFVGYSSYKKGYRIFYPFTNKMFESRDVKFSEEALCNWEAAEAELVE